MILATNLSGILFADLRNSSNDAGNTVSDWLSAQRLTQTLSLISEAIFSNRGVVTKSLKDAVFGTFPDPVNAVRAVARIDQLLATAEGTTRGGLEYRIGLHYAKLHVVAGSLSGEAFDIVIALAQGAAPGACRLSSALVEALGDNPLLAELGIHDSGEKLADGSAIYRLAEEHQTLEYPVARRETVTAQGSPVPTSSNVTAAPKPSARSPARTDAPTPSVIAIDYAGTRYLLDAAHPNITLGRGSGNQVLIDGPHVSRNHGQFEYRNGRFFFVDHSANGSCLVDSEGRETLVLQREIELSGSGEIGLGPTRAKSSTQLIRFQVG